MNSAEEHVLGELLQRARSLVGEVVSIEQSQAALVWWQHFEDLLDAKRKEAA